MKKPDRADPAAVQRERVFEHNLPPPHDRLFVDPQVVPECERQVRRPPEGIESRLYRRRAQQIVIVRSLDFIHLGFSPARPERMRVLRAGDARELRRAAEMRPIHVALAA